MNPENTEAPDPINQPATQSPTISPNNDVISQEQNAVVHKGTRSYFWYYAPLVATLVLVGLTQLATNHVCRNVASSDKGECVPGLWFFPTVLIEFIGFWTGIVLAVRGTVRIIKSRQR